MSFRFGAMPEMLFGGSIQDWIIIEAGEAKASGP